MIADYKNFRDRFKGKIFILNGKEISRWDFFMNATPEQIQNAEECCKDKRHWIGGVYLLADQPSEDES